MTTINKTITSHTGKKVDLTINIENGKVSGIARAEGQEFGVTGFAVVQNRQCLTLKKGSPAPYLPIDKYLYSEIKQTAKDQYRANMTNEQIAEGEMREAEAKYNRLFAQGYNNVEIIKAREEWDRLSAEYHQKYG